MKFGKQLATNRAPHWRYHFVDYDRLKAHLKSKSQDSQFSNEDEATFEKMLLTELDKVASFQELKLGEIQRRTEHCEQMIQRHQSSTSGSDSGASSPRSPSSTSSIEHSRLTLASFVATESEINKVTQDLQDLAHFQRLNYTAFLKILKKHDKHSGHALRAKFINTHLTNQPFHKQSLTPFVRRLSNLYNTVRTGTTSAANIAKAGSTESSEDETLMDQQGYIPGKASFWVHPDNIMDLKMLILKYLPLIVYEPTPGSAPPNRSQDAAESNLACDTPVSTVYLDNADLDLYLAHVEHQDRTETVRLRWFGSDNRHVWVEHQQKQLNKGKGPATSPSASSSVASMPHTTTTKHRFQIKSKNIPKLIEGNASLTKIIEAVRCTGQKSEQEINQFEERTRIVQSRIKKRHLQPVTQVFFNRTTFQVPGDSRVRITIDTDVSMIREKPVIPSTIYERPWSPSNRLQAENYSFPQANNQDIVRFPYAVMQIRTMTEPHDEAPAWVEYISQSHLVEMIPNFAKDQHAIATLYESRVGLLPFWLSDMDRDIRKMAVHSGYLRQSATPQDSDSSKAGSDDTLGSNDSTPATSISDVEPALKTTSSRRGSKKSGGKNKTKARALAAPAPSFISDPALSHAPAVKFQETVEEITVQRALLTGENTPSVSAGESDFFKKSGSKSSSSHPHPHHPHHHQPNEPPAKETFVTPVPLNRTASSSLTALAKKPVRPMVSCLKKHPSYSSIQSRHSVGGGGGVSDEDLVGSDGSLSEGGTRRRRKTVTFRRASKPKTLWTRTRRWIPFLKHSQDDDHSHSAADLEAQYTRGHGENSLEEGEENDSQWAQARRWLRSLAYRHSENSRYAEFSAEKLFWTSLSIVNVVLLFVGLVLALMNLGDSVGLEAASLFLIVSCVCMGSTVWAHLIRLDGHDDEEEAEEEHEQEIADQVRERNTARLEARGLLSGMTDSAKLQQHTPFRIQGRSLVSKSRWLRTRLLPVVTFVSLAAVVGLNAFVRAHEAGAGHPSGSD